MTASELEASLAKITEQQEQIEEKIDVLTVIMTGNGYPSKGLVLRFDRVERWWMDYTKKKSRLTATVIGLTATGLGNLILLGFNLWRGG